MKQEATDVPHARHGLNPRPSDRGARQSATLAYAYCHQGWRWNLDLAIDPNGNFTTYTYAQENSQYAINGDQSRKAAYTRGGYLTQIDYGFRGGEDRDASAVRVEFTTTGRCREALSGDACPGMGSANASSFPDVPVDLLCDPNCESAQSFFTGRRLDTITTMVRKGSSYVPVDQIKLVHQFPDPGDGSDPSLWLSRIIRTGLDGGSVALPGLNFNSANSAQSGPLPNRVESGVTPLKKYRIRTITNELGGTIEVNYGQPHPCTSPPQYAYNNEKNCFPQYFNPDFGSPGWAWFHKYLVTSVKVTDGDSDTSDDIVTTYTYQGKAGWRHSDDPMYEDSHNNESWTDWRGYERVIVTTGNTTTRTVYYRGMNGDKGTSGTVYVTDLDGKSHVDDPRLSGRPIQVMRMTGPTGAELETQSFSYWTGRTSDNGVVNDRDAYYARPATERLRAVKKDGTYRTTGTQTSYDATYGVPTSVLDKGDTAVSGDDSCTTTLYAVNAGSWMVVPARTEERSGNCTGTVYSRTETLLRRQRRPDGRPDSGQPDEGTPVHRLLHLRGDHRAVRRDRTSRLGDRRPG